MESLTEDVLQVLKFLEHFEYKAFWRQKALKHVILNNNLKYSNILQRLYYISLDLAEKQCICLASYSLFTE